MSMGSRKVNTEGIDEELLIASIGRRKQDGTLYRAQEPPVPAPEEESVPETEPPPTASPSREKVQKDIARRKRQEDDYSGLFLRRNEIKTRQCVYISRDVHSKILKIVNDIAGREISNLGRRLRGHRAAPTSGTAQGENKRTVQETT